MSDPITRALEALDEIQEDIDAKYPKPTFPQSYKRAMKRAEAYVFHEQDKKGRGEREKQHERLEDNRNGVAASVRQGSRRGGYRRHQRNRAGGVGYASSGRGRRRGVVVSDDEWPYLDQVTFLLPDGLLTTFGGFMGWLMKERPERVRVSS